MQPVRSNVARTKGVNDGKTGIRFGAEHDFVGAGVKDAYSKHLQVVANEKYYLAINNVYDDGQGADIQFDFFEVKKLKGTVRDEESNPVQSEVTWEDASTGEEIVKTTSDPKTGEFTMYVPFSGKTYKTYNLTSFREDRLPTVVTYSALDKNVAVMEPIRMVLPKLKKGKKVNLQSVNFVGNKAVFLEGAYPTLKRMAKLMKKNPSLKILIEGHTNGCNNGKSFSQKLSDDRAAVTKQYLIDKGIDASRITTVGKNCSEMLYPGAVGLTEQMLNRRIEVLVVSL